jgi:homoserine/homoserine lactone efflux protein
MNHGSELGMRKTSITIIGLEIGSITVFLIASIGLGAALLASEYIFLIIKIIGAFYLIYLGVMQWCASMRTSESASSEVKLPKKSDYKLFATGFLTNLSNPKGIIFMVAMLPQFIHQTESLLPQLLILATTMVVVDFFVMQTYALLALHAQKILKNPNAMRWQNRIFGGILIAIGMTLFFTKKQPLL